MNPVSEKERYDQKELEKEADGCRGIIRLFLLIIIIGVIIYIKK